MLAYLMYVAPFHLTAREIGVIFAIGGIMAGGGLSLIRESEKEKRRLFLGIFVVGVGCVFVLFVIYITVMALSEPSTMPSSAPS
jgi:hypothetical protein